MQFHAMVCFSKSAGGVKKLMFLIHCLNDHDEMTKASWNWPRNSSTQGVGSSCHTIRLR